MKQIIYFTTVIFLFMFSACSKDEEQSNNTNLFKIENSTYLTPNAYVFFEKTNAIDIQTGEEIVGFVDGFSLLLTDGTIAKDSEEDIYLSTDTKQNIFLSVIHNEDEDMTKIEDIEIISSDYTLSDETNAVYDITEMSTQLTKNGQSFGEIEAGFFLPFFDNDSGTVTIQSIELDYENKRGTIECTYNISSAAVGDFSGSFKGSFEIVISN